MESQLSEVAELPQLAEKLRALEIPAVEDGVEPYESSTRVPMAEMSKL